jgi:hypothetical protein
MGHPTQCQPAGAAAHEEAAAAAAAAADNWVKASTPRGGPSYDTQASTCHIVLHRQLQASL